MKLRLLELRATRHSPIDVDLFLDGQTLEPGDASLAECMVFADATLTFAERKTDPEIAADVETVKDRSPETGFAGTCLVGETKPVMAASNSDVDTEVESDRDTVAPPEPPTVVVSVKGDGFVTESGTTSGGGSCRIFVKDVRKLFRGENE